MKYISADEAWDEYKEIYLEGEDEDIADGFKDRIILLQTLPDIMCI